MFNFNEQDLEKADESKVFNDGTAGKVENVTASMEKLGVEYQSDSPNAPKYRVLFTDSEGRKTNRACFEIKAADFPDQWNRTFKDTIKKEWAYLAKIAEHTKGVKPMSFETAEELYSQMYTNGIGTEELNVFANYGSTNSPKDRIEVRKWLPAVEPAGTPSSESKLVAGNIDQMSFITPDTSEEDEEDSLF